LGGSWYNLHMNGQSSKKRIWVLTNDETRAWHSPFSKILQEARQNAIMERCERLARCGGFTEYAIYDAFENLVARGRVRQAA